MCIFKSHVVKNSLANWKPFLDIPHTHTHVFVFVTLRCTHMSIILESIGNIHLKSISICK